MAEGGGYDLMHGGEQPPLAVRECNLHLAPRARNLSLKRVHPCRQVATA